MKNIHNLNIKLFVVVLFSGFATCAMGDCNTAFATVTIINNTSLSYNIQMPDSQQCNCPNNLSAGWKSVVPTGGSATEISGPIYIEEKGPDGNYTNSCMEKNNGTSVTNINLIDPKNENAVAATLNFQTIRSDGNFYLTPNAWMDGKYGIVTTYLKMDNMVTIVLDY